MSNIAFKKIESVKGKQEFFKAYVDGECQFDEYEREIEENGAYIAELRTVYARMELVANMQILPEQKFKELKGGKGGLKEYEIKTKNLRVYLTHIEKLGKFVIRGGYKNSQKKDIAKFRSIKDKIDPKTLEEWKEPNY